jgi:filamentous hemagglutinin family protein
VSKALSPWFGLSLCTLGYLYATSNTALAQVTSDGTVNTQVNQNGNVAEITGGQTRGGNLFHSFRDFSVGTGDTASFLNSNDIANIFSRVTGGNISNIDGLIRANGSANLFLINPAGILFGENARLDVGGSFYGSTASSILFDEGEFSATDLENPPVLTINAPIGLGFRDNPEDIVNQSRALDSTGQAISGLRVQPEKNLALVGGNVSLDGGVIVASGGRVELGGLTAAGTVGINNDGSLSFPERITRGDVSFTNIASVFVIGEQGGNIAVNANNLEISGNSTLRGGTLGEIGLPNGQSGDILVNATGAIAIDSSEIDNSVNIGNAGNVEINADSLSLTNGGLIASSTFGTGNAGNVTVNATNNISLKDANSTILSNVEEGAVGNGGQITVDTGTLNLTKGGQILTIVREARSNLPAGEGNAGNITINARDTVNLDGVSEDSNQFPSGFRSTVGDSAIGNGGNIEITSGSVDLTNGAGITSSTSSSGDGGNLIITAKQLSVRDGAGLGTDTFSAGNAGNLTINVENFTVQNSRISASTDGQGNAGDLTVNATESIELSGEYIDENGNPIGPGGLLAQSDLDATGKGGNLTVETQRLSISNGSKIQAATFNNGDAGEIEIYASEIDIFNTPGVTTTYPTEINAGSVRDKTGANANSPLKGNGGSIKIETDQLNIRNEAGINEAGIRVSSEGQGKSGDLNIQTENLNLSDRSQLLAETASGEGGNINLKIDDTLTMRNNSLISAQAFNNANGGNVNINANFIVAFPNQIDGNGSDIIASAAEGDGGRININGESLLGIQERKAIDNNQTNDIDASSEFGLDGTVSIFTPDLNPVQGATELPSNVVEPEQTTEQACQADRETAAKNGLIVRGKGGIPAPPDQPLTSQNLLINGEITSASAIPEPIETSQGKIHLARGIKFTKDGGIILTPLQYLFDKRLLLHLFFGCLLLFDDLNARLFLLLPPSLPRRQTIEQFLDLFLLLLP